MTITLSGADSRSTISDAFGAYQFSALSAGESYTVTPSKPTLPPGASGINTTDVIAVQRHFLGFAFLTGCRLLAADVNGDELINTSDVIAIQRFALGLSTGVANVGAYVFLPPIRSYSDVSNDQVNQDYDAFVLGDVASPFVP